MPFLPIIAAAGVAWIAKDVFFEDDGRAGVANLALLGMAAYGVYRLTRGSA